MKVILTGATGTIGSAILPRLLSLPGVTRVVALSRRAPTVSHAKLEVVLVSDFKTAYSDPAVRGQLAGAAACVWALGSPRDGADVHVDFTLAAVKGLRGIWEEGGGEEGGRAPFRFVYTSGSLVVRDQDAWLLLAGEKRKMRGRVENELLAFEKAHEGSWESYIMRPGFVLDERPTLLGWLEKHILKSQLAAAAGKLATEGEEKRIWENVELGQLGGQVLGEETEKK